MAFLLSEATLVIIGRLVFRAGENVLAVIGPLHVGAASAVAVHLGHDSLPYLISL